MNVVAHCKIIKGGFYINYFLRLNIVSIINALMIFISFELQLNFYRIARITNWETDAVNLFMMILHVLGFILWITVLLLVNGRWLQYRKSRYISSFLWFPYLIFFILLFASIFPITYRGDDPSPAIAFIIIGQLIIFPFFLAFIFFIGKAISTEPEYVLSKE